MSGPLKENKPTMLSGGVVQTENKVGSFPNDPDEDPQNDMAGHTAMFGNEEMTRNVSKGLRPFFRNIERLPVSQLSWKLETLNLRKTGNKEILLKRLKRHYERKKLAECNLLAKVEYPPFFVVIDFEATCIEVNPPDYPHEIIEFPAVLVATKTRTIEDTFQEYVRPEINPKLSNFCIELTGITQDIVSAADTFPIVLEKFKKWLLKHGLINKKMYRIVTDGPWDMAQFLHGQCVLSAVPYPSFAKTWINLRKAFRKYYKCKTCHLRSMLGVLGLQFEGRPHCGRDDAINIANVLLNLIDDLASLEVNEKLDLSKQKLRERALLRAAIAEIEKRGDASDADKLQKLKTALAERTRRRVVMDDLNPVGTFDDPESNNSSSDEEGDADSESRLRPKVLSVKTPVSDESADESPNLDDNVTPADYSEFASENKFSILTKAFK